MTYLLLASQKLNGFAWKRLTLEMGRYCKVFLYK